MTSAAVDTTLLESSPLKHRSIPQSHDSSLTYSEAPVPAQDQRFKRPHQPQAVTQNQTYPQQQESSQQHSSSYSEARANMARPHGRSSSLGEAYPLFIDVPNRSLVERSADDRGREQFQGVAAAAPASRFVDGGALTTNRGGIGIENPTRCILDRIRTMRLESPSLRRAHQTRAASPPTNPQGEPSAAAVAASRTARRVSGGEPSAFAVTNARMSRHLNLQLAFPEAGNASADEQRSSDQREQSLQQRRRQHQRSGTIGSPFDVASPLTITSPTARQARGTPAAAMVWLPDDQVWLLAEGANVSGPAASVSASSYPLSAPMRPDRARSHERPRAQDEGRGRRTVATTTNAPEGHRLQRSDSSPIRSQFMSLIERRSHHTNHEANRESSSSNTQVTAADWSFALRPQAHHHHGPSAVEEDAIWYAEQQARATARRDQDRFSPMFQQALAGIDLPTLDAGSSRFSAATLAVPTAYGHQPDLSFLEGGHTMRRASTVTGSPIGRERRERRESSLRSRVSTVGNADYDEQAASLMAQTLREQAPRRDSQQRRWSDGETVSTPRVGSSAMAAGSGHDSGDFEWLAGVIAQGYAPEGLFSPKSRREGQGNGGGDTTPKGLEPPGGWTTIPGGRNRSVTMTGDGRVSGIIGSRWMSVSTQGGEEASPVGGSASWLADGEISPVSSRGRDSVSEGHTAIGTP